MSSQEDTKIVFVLGPPGAGKGTLCKHISEKFNHFHLSVGDYLRKMAATPNLLPAGIVEGGVAQLKSDLPKGTLLPAREIVDLVQEKLNAQRTTGHTVILIDGFPRSAESARLFAERVTEPTVILLFECPRDTAKQRYLDRAREASDTGEKFEKRFQKFEDNNEAILSLYGDRVMKIDTSGTVEKSKQEIEAALGLAGMGTGAGAGSH